MKQLWTALFVTGILAVAGSGAFAQRYVPPSGSGTTGGTTGTTGGTTTTPATHNPDPFGLTLAASGTAAAVGYVMRRKRAAA